MKQHPLPQNISSYQFHLIGSMTLKQFMLLAGGFLIAWIFYSLPLFSLFRLPLTIASALIGILFAFIPYQDRPLDAWLSTFIKSIYSPTHFLWKKSPRLPDFIKHKSLSTPLQKLPDTKQTQPTKTKLTNYLKSLPQTKSKDIDPDINRLKTINQLFKTIVPSQPPNPTKPSQKSQDSQLSLSPKSVKIEVRKLKTPPPDYSTPPNKTTQSHTQSKSQQPSNNTLLTPLANISNQTIKSNLTKTLNATVNTQLPFPSIPSVPNVIVGMTLDQNRNILDNSIVEIRDQTGHPVRALKSNKLGQFFIATPLPNGIYELETEKPGYKFNLVKLNLDGQIVKPIELNAKSGPAVV